MNSQISLIKITVVALLVLASGIWTGYQIARISSPLNLHTESGQPGASDTPKTPEAVQKTAPQVTQPGPTESSKSNAPEFGIQEFQTGPQFEPLDPLAIAAFRGAGASDDPRAPKLSPFTTRERPSPDTLADHDAYQRYEQNQTRQLMYAYTVAADEKIQTLEEELIKARALGINEHEYQVGAEKLRRIKAMQQELKLTIH